MKSFARSAIAALAMYVLFSTGAAQAALVTRAVGMVYDDVLDITWLADWNYAKTSGYDSLGAMQWSRAVAWAENLTYGGFEDWRLPTIPVACLIAPPAYGCAGNEMGHMYYNNLGGREGGSIVGVPNATNLALFSNIQPYYYWTGTDELVGSVYAWAFAANSAGYHVAAEKGYQFFAVAVRDGDVLIPIPEPESYLLALTALGVLALVRYASRRRLRQAHKS